MENIYVLVAYVAAMVALVGAGLLVLSHFLDGKAEMKKAQVLIEQGLPALEQMQNRMVKKVLRETTREMKTMTRDMIKMQGLDD